MTPTSLFQLEMCTFHRTTQFTLSEVIQLWIVGLDGRLSEAYGSLLAKIVARSSQKGPSAKKTDSRGGELSHPMWL